MECLRDLIGLRGCGAPAPTSSFYVNDLDGISAADLQRAATEEQATFLGVWNACLSRALGRMATEIPKAFAKRYRLKTVMRAIDLQRRINQTVTTPAAAKYRGFTVQLRNANSWWVPSLFQVVYLSSFSLFVPVAIPSGTVSVKLFDLESGDVLDTFTVTNPPAGWNTVRVERSYAVYRLALAYDASAIDSVYQQVPPAVVDSWISSTSYIYGPTCCGWIRGIETADLTGASSFTEMDNTFGLTANFSYQCRWDNLVCNNRQMFAYPLLYLLGGELMHAMTYTAELNRFNTVDRNDAEKLISQYYGEAGAALQQACDGIELDSSDACVDCSAPYQIIEALP